MSCPCDKYINPLEQIETNCPCDTYIHPPELSIPAGLDSIPRQIAGFPEFRRAMLNSIRSKPVLSDWRARGDIDLGIMLIEMWAYVCDVQSFYDEVIAHEVYVRTARQRPSLRKLTGLLGYLPRPATSASVRLALFGEGRKPVIVPAGMAFRSGAFDGESPQLFETTSEFAIHPLNNRWNLSSVPERTIGGSGGSGGSTSRLLLRPDTVNLKATEIVLVYVSEFGIYGRAGKRSIYPGIAKGDTYGGKAVGELLSRHGMRNVKSKLRKDDASGGMSYTSLFDLNEGNRKIDYEIVKGSFFGSMTGDVLFDNVSRDGQTLVGTADNVSQITGKDGNPYTQVDFSIEVALSNNKKPEKITLQKPTQTASLWKLPHILNDPYPIDGKQTTTLVLDNVYSQIRPAQSIILQAGNELRWFTVVSTSEIMMQMNEARMTQVPVAGNVSISVPTPATKTPVTRLSLDAHIDSQSHGASKRSWNNSVLAQHIIVHYEFINAGTVTAENQIYTELTDSHKLETPIEEPEGFGNPENFFLKDKDDKGVMVEGGLDYKAAMLELKQGTVLEPKLKFPVEVYGNIVNASHGETVMGESLGSGDASVSNQSFTLKKKPLTYLPSPTLDNESGVANTLQVYVNSIRWREVRTFFAIGPEEEVYIVRQNDDGDSTITFGDGIRGARVHTGTENVVANYRFGAGEASPPEDSITQIAKPVKGVGSVENPVAAAGGSDAESSDNIRTYAPKSTLILGRAVSIYDMEAVASSEPGVRAVSAEWRWHEVKQRAVIQIWYIGANEINETISQKLRSLSEDTNPIGVTTAQGINSKLSLQLEIDPRYLEINVLSTVRSVLMDKDRGLLAPERIGIGKPLYRSKIFGEVTAIEGVVAVDNILWNGESFKNFAMSPGAGKYFDLEEGMLLLNGKEKFSV